MCCVPGYRPPGAVSRVLCDQLADVFDQLLPCGRRFVVCGDFNCPGAGDHDQLDTSIVDVLQRYTVQSLAARSWCQCHARRRQYAGPFADADRRRCVVSGRRPPDVLQRPLGYTVACQLHLPRNVTAVRYQFRDLRRIDIAAFQRDVYRSRRSTISTARRKRRVRPTVQQRNAMYSRLTRSAQDANSTCRT